MTAIDFNLYLITDRKNLPQGTTLSGQLEAALRGGVKAVQLREKDLSANELLRLATELRQLTNKYGAKLLINSCLETTLAVKADGIHLNSHKPPIRLARKELGHKALIGVSTHSIGEVQQAVDAGADFVTFGPVYFTPSKASYGDPLGLEELKNACAISRIPVFALGGINPDNFVKIQHCGCTQVACIGAIFNSTDPEAAVQALLA